MRLFHFSVACGRRKQESSIEYPSETAPPFDQFSRLFISPVAQYLCTLLLKLPLCPSPPLDALARLFSDCSQALSSRAAAVI